MAKVKNKKRLLKATTKKQLVVYKGNPTRLSADFSVETFQARREWQDVFKMLKRKKTYYQEYTTQQGYHKELESFPEKQNLKTFITTKPALQKNVKGSSLSRKEKAITRSRKIHKRKKNLTGKGKYIKKRQWISHLKCQYEG